MGEGKDRGMNNITHKTRISFLFKVICVTIAVLLAIESTAAYALEVARTNILPAASSDFLLGAKCNALLPQGLTIDPSQPFRFDLLVESSDAGMPDGVLREESQKLVKYFLASVAIPGNELWVNLSPRERDRMLTENFGRTDMGRDLMIQDYWLKTLSTQATNPESQTGKIFWDKLYEKIYETYGRIDVPVESFQRVWIVPQSADVVVTDRSAYITNARLRVMLESDYLRQTKGAAEDQDSQMNIMSTDVMREIVIPYLEERVNSGDEFANLRQIYRALILAVWFKKNLQSSVFHQLYADQGQVNGIDLKSDTWKSQVFDKYLENFRAGAYNIIKDQYDPSRQEVTAHSYFSGGVDYASLTTTNLMNTHAPSIGFDVPMNGSVHRVGIQMITDDHAMMSLPSMRTVLMGLFVTLAFMFVSQSVSAAEYGRDVQGNLIVTVEQGDQLGKIAHDIKDAYKVTALDRYRQSQFQGNMWKSKGAFETVKDHVIQGDTDDLKPGDQLKISKEVAPDDVLDQLASDGEHLDTDPDAVPFGADELPTEDGASGSQIDSREAASPVALTPQEGMEANAASGIGAAVGITAPEHPAFVIPQSVRNFLLALAVSAVLLFGFERFQSKRRSRAGARPEAIPRSQEAVAADVLDGVVTFAGPDIAMQPFVFSGVGVLSVDTVQTFTDIPERLLVHEEDVVPTEDVLALRDVTTEGPLDGVLTHGAPEITMSAFSFAYSSGTAAQSGEPSIVPADPHALAGVYTPATGAMPMSVFAFSGHLPAADVVLIPQKVATRARPQALVLIDMIVGVFGFSAGGLSGDPLIAVAGGFSAVAVNRILTVIRLWMHERSHLWKARRLIGESVDTPENRLANMTVSDWIKLLIPFIPFRQNLEPRIELGAVEDSRLETIRRFGFFYTLGESLVTAGTAIAFTVLNPTMFPLILTLAVAASAITVLRASYDTDIRQGLCGTAAGCGNFGFFWKPSSTEKSRGFRALFPRWAERAADEIVRQLSTRGGQSQGINIFYRSGLSARTLVGKHVKGKRWSPTLSRGTLKALRRDLRKAMIRMVLSLPAKIIPSRIQLHESEDQLQLRWFGVFGLTGHVRFTTSSRVTAPASHPHLYQERRRTWTPLLRKEKKVLAVQDGDVLVSITHNGDNDGIYMFSNPLIENERGEYLDFDKAKAFFMKLLGVAKIATGDSPLVALQTGFYMTQGSWKASARLAHTLGVNDSLAEAESRLQAPESWDVIGDFFDGIFERLLSDEATREYLTALFDPNLQFEIAKLEGLKNIFIQEIAAEIDRKSRVGELMSRWPAERLGDMMDVMLESFFRFDRYRAVKEFQKMADGAYGLVVRTSLGGDTGITMLSRDQPLVYGFNQSRDLFAYASDHTSLLVGFGDYGDLKDLVLLKPNGQIADLFFDPSNNLQLSMRVFDSQKQRELNREEIIEQSYPLQEGSRYYKPLIEYRDPDNKVQEDLQRVPADLQALMETWNDTDSFNRRTAEALFRKFLSKYLMSVARRESGAYVKIQHRLLKDIRADLRTLLTRDSFANAAIQETFIQQIAERIFHETVFGEYAISALDDVTRRWSRDLSLEAQSQPAAIKEHLYQHIGSLNDTLDRRTTELVSSINHLVMARLKDFLQHQKPQNGSVISINNSQDWMSRMIASLNDAQVPFRPAPQHPVDVVISGYSDSDLIDQNLAETLKKVFPDLSVQAIGANDLLRNQDMVGPETIVILTSKSGGQTFATGALAGILQKITPGNIFGSVGRPDSLMSVALGQKLLANQQPIDRMFVTGNTYPSESNTVSEVLMYAQQLKIVEYLAERMNQTFVVLKPFGMTLSRKNIEFFKRQTAAMVAESERLSGFKADGTSLETVEHRSIREMAKRLSRKVWEPMATLVGSVAYIVYSVALAPAGLPTLATALLWFSSLINAQGSFVVGLVSVIHAVFYITLPWLLAVAYRALYGLPLWTRIGVQPTTISEKGYFGLMHELLLSKLGAQSWPWMTMSVYSGDGRSEVPAKFAHRIQRSGTLFSAMPVFESRAAFKTTLSQSKNIMNYMWGGLRRLFPDFLLGGPDVITVGKGDFSNPNANHFHVTTGDVPGDIADILEKIDNKKPVTDEELNNLTIYNFAGDEFSRFVAFKQLFGYAYVPFRRLWNVEESFPRIGVHSTRSSEVPNDSVRVHPADYFRMLEKSTPAQAVNSAMLSEDSAPGGIDLNPDYLNLNETAAGSNSLTDHAMMFDLKNPPEFFIPVIIGIEPVKTDFELKALLGFGAV